jgi:predicted DNA-binding transcriptional regulator YafY
MRVFAIDNIDAIAVQPQTFERPSDFNLEAYGAHSVSGVFQGTDLTDVTVRFSPVIAKAATAASIARDRRIERRADGSVDITYRVADPLEIVRWSLSWGTEGEVIAPPSAREHARSIARTLAKTYDV